MRRCVRLLLLRVIDIRIRCPPFLLTVSASSSVAVVVLRVGILSAQAVALMRPVGRNGRTKAVWSFHFDGPPKTRFQTTVNQSGGSLAIAERIARLCYDRFEAGDTKDYLANAGRSIAATRASIGRMLVLALALRHPVCGG